MQSQKVMYDIVVAEVLCIAIAVYFIILLNDMITTTIKLGSYILNW